MPPEDEYESAAELYGAFGTRLSGLLQELLNASGLKALEVVTRVKKRKSAADKIARPDISASTWSDLHDFLGARVITYFADDVDRVAKIVESEFDIDETRSTDKRKRLDPDQFGYLSVHYVARLDATRTTLAEWRRFENLYFEIQIRSILQHSWAEIEHDLGYKPGETIPKSVRRRFSRLAGILELADDEFIGIRDELKKSEAAADAALVHGQSIPLDQSSIFALIQRNATIAEVDERIAAGRGAKLIPVTRQWSKRLAGDLLAVGLNTTEDVINVLQVEGDGVADFAVAWMTEPEPGYQEEPFYSPRDDGEYEDEDEDDDEVSRGISVFYLPLYLLAKTNDADEVLENWPFGFDRDRAEHFLRVFRRLQGLRSENEK